MVSQKEKVAIADFILDLLAREAGEVNIFSPDNDKNGGDFLSINDSEMLLKHVTLKQSASK